MAGSEEKQSSMDLDEMELGNHEEEAYSSDDGNFEDSQLGILERINRNFEAEVEKKTRELRNAYYKEQLMKRDIKDWKERALGSDLEVNRLLEKIVKLKHQVRDLEQDNRKLKTKSEKEGMVKDQAILNIRQMLEAQKDEVKSWRKQSKLQLQKQAENRKQEVVQLEQKVNMVKFTYMKEAKSAIKQGSSVGSFSQVLKGVIVTEETIPDEEGVEVKVEEVDKESEKVEEGKTAAEGIKVFDNEFNGRKEEVLKTEVTVMKPLQSCFSSSSEEQEVQYILPTRMVTRSLGRSRKPRMSDMEEYGSSWTEPRKSNRITGRQAFAPEMEHTRASRSKKKTPAKLSKFQVKPSSNLVRVPDDVETSSKKEAVSKASGSRVNEGKRVNSHSKSG